MIMLWEIFLGRGRVLVQLRRGHAAVSNYSTIVDFTSESVFNLLIPIMTYCKGGGGGGRGGDFC